MSLKPRYLSFALAMGASSVLGHLPAQAQSASGVTASAQAAGELADGEVRKVDKENKKVTLKHGPIDSLDMPPMTMVFQVADASMLDKLQPGDKVRFRVARQSGRMTVTEIQSVK
ncbi:MAG: copper-binding protein [Ramlibacter sp.]|nr:copper-binding protein [Ramlibacter sp.]